MADPIGPEQPGPWYLNSGLLMNVVGVAALFFPPLAPFLAANSTLVPGIFAVANGILHIFNHNKSIQ